MSSYTCYITEEAWENFSDVMKTKKAEVVTVKNTFFIVDPNEENSKTKNDKVELLNLRISITFWDEIMKKAKLEEVIKQDKMFIVKKEKKEWDKNNEGVELLIKKLEEFK